MFVAAAVNLVTHAETWGFCLTGMLSVGVTPV